MNDESLAALDEYVQNLTRAEYEDVLNQEYEKGKRDGYHAALNDKFRYFHIWWWIKSMLRGKLFCATCNKFMLRSKVQDYRTGFCSVECRDNYLPF